MKLIMNTRAAVAILMATAMIFSSILLEPLQASAVNAGPPGTPSNVMAVGNADSISVSWSAPTGGGAAVVKYEIRWRIFGPIERPDWISVDAGTTAGSYLITGLVEWGLYDLELYAIADGCPIISDCYSEAAIILAVALETDAEWIHEISASTTLTVKRGPGQAFGPDGYLPDNYFVWSDLANAGELSFDLEVDSDTTFMDVRLYPFDETTRLLSATGLEINHNFADIAPEVVSDPGEANGLWFDIADLCDVTCPTVFRFEVTTFKDDVREVIDAIEYFYLVRKQDAQTFVLKYENPSGITAKFSADDPRWIQVVDSSSIGVENVSWVETLSAADLFIAAELWPSVGGKYFGGWCLTPTPDDMEDDCLDPSEDFPVYRDNVLYPLWVTDLEPTSISFGDQTFTSQSLRRDPGERTFYLTVGYYNEIPSIGPATIEGQIGVDFNTLSMDVIRLDSDLEMDPDPNTGEYQFVPSCTNDDCAEIFVLRGNISAGGQDLGEEYTIKLIVASNLTAEFDVSFDATPGALTPLILERINQLENQPVGWYPIPTGEFARTGYSHESSWLDSVTAPDTSGETPHNGWDTYFPLLANETLRLDWFAGPLISVATEVEINKGAAQVATASATTLNVVPVSWALTGNTHFYVSQSGVITADPLLEAGSYTFSLVATYEFAVDDRMEGPPVEVTVTVVERSQVGSSENTDLPPTNQTGAGQHLPKPGSKLQADLISKVSRSKLAVGGTAQFGVTGGEPGATRVFASNNPRICSINARGLVTAKSTGVCLISATATAQDPVFAPASAPLTKIVVLGSGLINNAKVTVFKGQVSIKASLLKSLAGKSVKLAIEVERGGKSVLVPMRREVLSKSATATFKSFAKPRPGTRVVLTIGGRAVHALTL